MGKFLIPISIVVLVIALSIFLVKIKMSKTITIDQDKQEERNSIHSLSAKTLLKDEEINLSEYKGKVLLIVNTASKCGLTPQYKSLQALHQKYDNRGLAILGFPSNDFLNQEPGTEAEIADFCERNYGVTFDLFQKVKVKGGAKHPIYEFLTQKSKNGVLDSKVEWNFQKYLLDGSGKLVSVFKPKVSVDDPGVLSKIEELLEENED